MLKFSRQRGTTLLELLCVLVIIATMTMAATSFGKHFLPRQRLVAAANNLVGIIHAGRDVATSGAPILLCALGTDCDNFLDAPGVYILADTNENGRRDPGEEVISELRLPEGMTVGWRSFRRKPWLRFTPQKISWYQNGNLRLCADTYSLKVIVSRIGRPRVDRSGIQTAGC